MSNMISFASFRVCYSFAIVVINLLLHALYRNFRMLSYRRAEQNLLRVMMNPFQFAMMSIIMNPLYSKIDMRVTWWPIAEKVTHTPHRNLQPITWNTFIYNPRVVAMKVCGTVKAATTELRQVIDHSKTWKRNETPTNGFAWNKTNTEVLIKYRR